MVHMTTPVNWLYRAGTAHARVLELEQQAAGLYEQLVNAQAEIVRLQQHADCLEGLLREARGTRAADIVPNGWANRVDAALKDTNND